MMVALFDKQSLVGNPEQLIIEDENDTPVPYSKGILDKSQVKESFRLPVLRSKSFAFFLQKWTTSAGLLMVVNTEFKPVNATSLLKKLAEKAIPIS